MGDDQPTCSLSVESRIVQNNISGITMFIYIICLRLLSLSVANNLSELEAGIAAFLEHLLNVIVFQMILTVWV